MCCVLFVCPSCVFRFLFFFFNDTATTEIYTLSLHDALPIYEVQRRALASIDVLSRFKKGHPFSGIAILERTINARIGKLVRSEEHTSELQSRLHLVCRLLLEKKKNANSYSIT